MKKIGEEYHHYSLIIRNQKAKQQFSKMTKK